MMHPLLKRMLYPSDVVCLGCEGLADSTALCTGCRSLLDACRLTGALCSVCGQPLDEDGLCSLCAHGWVLEARSAFAHTGLARELVHQLKFDNRRDAAVPLAGGMLPLARELTEGLDAALSWLPMPESRYRERDYDHARLLAEQLAHAMGLPLRSTLIRVEGDRPLAHQLGLSAAERAQNLRGTFAPGADVNGCILLIDDVITTGATAALASECLLQHGAARVIVLSATRALRHDD